MPALLALSLLGYRLLAQGRPVAGCCGPAGEQGMGGRPIPPHSRLNGGFNFYSSQIDKLRDSLNATPRSHDRMKLLTKTLFTKQSGLVLVLLAASGSSAPPRSPTTTSPKPRSRPRRMPGARPDQISDDYRSGGIDKARATATAVLDGAYGYHHGPVLFKPTLAGGEQTFRINQEGALAYFVGNNQAYPPTPASPSRTGRLQLRQRRRLHQRRHGPHHGQGAPDRPRQQADHGRQDLGLQEGDDGKVRIVLHHSSLPTPANGNRRPAGRLFCYGGNSLATRRVTTGPVLLPCLPCDDSRRDTHADPPLHPE